MLNLVLKSKPFFAVQYTREHYEAFVAQGKTPDQNPVDVKIEGFNGSLSWNWHLKELTVEVDGDVWGKKIEVGQYLVFSDKDNPGRDLINVGEDFLKQHYNIISTYSPSSTEERITELERVLLEAYRWIDDCGAQSGVSHICNLIESTIDTNSKDIPYEKD